MLIKTLFVIFLTGNIHAMDCNIVDQTKDAKYYNLCTKACENDKDCEIVTNGCDKFPVNKTHKNSFTAFLKDFPSTSCDHPELLNCITAKCLNKVCVLNKASCTSENSAPEVSNIIKPAFEVLHPRPQQTLFGQTEQLSKVLNDSIALVSVKNHVNRSDNELATKCSHLKDQLKEIVLDNDNVLSSASITAYFEKYPNDFYCNLYLAFQIQKTDPVLTSFFKNPDLFKKIIKSSIKKLSTDDLKTLIDFLIPRVGPSQYMSYMIVNTEKKFLDLDLKFKNKALIEKNIYSLLIELVINKHFTSKEPIVNSDTAFFFFQNILIKSHPVNQILNNMRLNEILFTELKKPAVMPKLNLVDDITSGRINESNLNFLRSALMDEGLVRSIGEKITQIFDSKNISNNLKCMYLDSIRANYPEVYTESLSQKIKMINFASVKCVVDFTFYDSLMRTKKIGECSANLFPAISSSAFYRDYILDGAINFLPPKNDTCLSACKANEECVNLAKNPCYVFPGNMKYLNEYSAFFNSANPLEKCPISEDVKYNYRCDKGKCVQNKLKNRDEVQNFLQNALNSIKSNKKLYECQRHYECSFSNMVIQTEDKQSLNINIGHADNFESRKFIKEIKSNFKSDGGSVVGYSIEMIKSKTNQCLNGSCAYFEIIN